MLARDFASFGDERQRLVDQALLPLSEGAAAQRVEVERLADSLFDEREGRERPAGTMRQEEHLRAEGKRLIEATRTPAEQMAETRRRWMAAAATTHQAAWRCRGQNNRVRYTEMKRLPMRKPSGKYNVFNKVTYSSGTSH